MCALHAQPLRQAGPPDQPAQSPSPVCTHPWRKLLAHPSDETCPTHPMRMCECVRCRVTARRDPSCGGSLVAVSGVSGDCYDPRVWIIRNPWPMYTAVACVGVRCVRGRVSESECSRSADTWTCILLLWAYGTVAPERCAHSMPCDRLCVPYVSYNNLHL